MSESENAGETFEALLANLEAIVDRLSADDVELDEALALFESGVAGLRQAGSLLDSAEGRVEELIETASGDLESIGFEVPTREET